MVKWPQKFENRARKAPNFQKLSKKPRNFLFPGVLAPNFAKNARMAPFHVLSGSPNPSRRQNSTLIGQRINKQNHCGILYG